MRRSAAPSRIVGPPQKRISIPCALTNTQTFTDVSHNSELNPDIPESRCFEVVYSKASNTKHKIWKDDGFIIISDRCVKLLNEERKTIASTLSYSMNYLNSVNEGSLLKVAGYHAELLRILSTAVCKSDTNSSVNYAGITRCVGTHGLVKKDMASMSNLPSVCRKTQPITNRRQRCSVSEALVLPRPPIDCIWLQNPEGLAIRDVVLESQFAKRLRPHQKEGIIFLYECVMGFRSHRLPGRVSCSLSACDFDSPTSNPVCGCILA
ncbi:hypothetical protein EG68_11288 [Paragonimus skrjabini miyazakii]|uniref:DUF2439 domain-containing protein n=1 Tax=Paragonimus skrjabini miyazakii TaxID=59628 RepID=A0A8S9YFL5_9TREM|nr:hypothetical protein EG68_11288 [Paragonimus skrjabini miyazakii]